MAAMDFSSWVPVQYAKKVTGRARMTTRTARTTGLSRATSRTSAKRRGKRRTK